MQPIKKLTHAKIQQGIRESVPSVNRILKSLGIDKQTTIQELYKFVVKDLKDVQFELKYDRGLCNAYGNQSVPGFTRFNTSNRTDGGIIYLNPDYSVQERRETLIHEYIHIKDHSLPIYSTHVGAFENQAAFYKFYLELNKYQADMGDATTLPEQMKLDILANTNDIAKVLGKYQELYKYILDDLNKMHFRIMYDINLQLPAFTQFNTSNKTDGGIIRLSPYYSTNEQLEALYYEYVNIIDYVLPIYEMYITSPEYKAMIDNFYQELVELQADMSTYTLLMPLEQLMQNLIITGYNIDEVLKKYYYMEKSSVLQWITINAPLPCHFAWVMLEKDNDNNIVKKVHHDNCYYDHQNNPMEFDIETILDIADSAAAIAMNGRKNMNKPSTINGKDYYCYAYYEKDQSKEIRTNNIMGSVSISYDRLLVIGWEKTVYDFIQGFVQSFKSIQRR